MKSILLYSLCSIAFISGLSAQSNLTNLADNRNPREKRISNVNVGVIDTLKTSQDILAEIANVGYDLTKGAVDNFKDPNVIEPSASLPVRTFNSSVYNNQVQLKWSAAMALNDIDFTIERQDASGKWNPIGKVRNGSEEGTAMNYSFTDASPVNGDNRYRLTQTVGSTVLYSQEKNVEVLRGSKGMVFQNYPNPFTTTTTIRYEMREAGNLKIAIYNMNGLLVKMLANQTQAKGSYTLNWDSGSLPIGTYICKIYTDTDNITTKMIKAR
jgi:hypothetical protein